MSDKKLPKQIRSILTEDETIEKSFHLKGRKVYATNKRLLDLAGRTVMDYDYTHISSIGYTSKRYWWLIILGIIITVIGVFIGFNVDIIGIIIGSVIGGIVFIVIGAIAKSESVSVNVVGVGEVPYKGSGDELDSLLQIVRKKRLAEPAISQKETRNIDFVDTIKRLAQLRDEGVLTQEEFEEKKSKILKDSN
jgi:hypothetical protein